MKKPNITKGEWSCDKIPNVYADGDIIALIRPDNKDNAKAISAVPEMIDALIDLVKDNPSVSREVYDKIEKALKKAGVEL